MRRYLSSIGHSCSRVLRAGQDRTRPARAVAGGSSAGSARAARARAILAAAIAGSLLLPFSGGAASVASAAPSRPSPNLVRAAESPDGLIHLALVPGENEARYIMSVSTLGQAPKNAACTTRDVTGEIVLTPEGIVVPELSKIAVDQRTLACEAPLRDSMAQQLLQTDQHPLAEFAVRNALGLGAPLPAGDVAFQLDGDQSVRGVTQPAVYDTTASFTPETMVGQARTTLKMTSFGITPPSIGPLIQVSDDMVAEVDLSAVIASPAAGEPVPAGDPAAAPAAGDPAIDPAADPAAAEEPAAPAEAAP